MAMKYPSGHIFETFYSPHQHDTYRIQYMKKTEHEGDEGTVAFWLYMRALYKDE